MTWKFTSMSRTFSTSRIHREVIQHQGHSGSNQKSARDLPDVPDISVIAVLSSVVTLQNRLPYGITEEGRPLFPG